MEDRRRRATSDGRLGPARDLLRFATAGSVDGNESTLVGRLLCDQVNCSPSQIRAVESAPRSTRGHDHARPVAARRRPARRSASRASPSTWPTATSARRPGVRPRRHPGHVRYTRNTVTGASTAELAVLLVDARSGVVAQTGGTPRCCRCCGAAAGPRDQQDRPHRLRRGQDRQHRQEFVS
ncbi:hypothetical protein HBB16_19890 [Pseudonocardia sp. MCCB 268]|nr:hypothetical protein [Pseudonocardia cytotoxica]